MTRPIANPLSGEVADETTTVEDLRMWEAMLSDQISPLWRARENLRTAIADRTDTPRMPRPSRQTDVQRKVSLCPNCRRKYGTTVAVHAAGCRCESCLEYERAAAEASASSSKESK